MSEFEGQVYFLAIAAREKAAYRYEFIFCLPADSECNSNAQFSPATSSTAVVNILNEVVVKLDQGSGDKPFIINGSYLIYKQIRLFLQPLSHPDSHS